MSIFIRIFVTLLDYINDLDMLNILKNCINNGKLILDVTLQAI